MKGEFLAAINNPPFGLRTALWAILSQWESGPPSPALLRYLAQIFVEHGQMRTTEVGAALAQHVGTADRLTVGSAPRTSVGR